MKKLSIFLMIIGLSMPAFGKTDEQLLKDYVQTLISDGYKLFNNSKLNEEEKNKKTSELLENNLYLDWMAKYVLGRHKRALSDEKVNEFSAIYSKFVVKAYVDLAQHYNGEKAKLNKVVQLDEDMFMVHMEIVKPDESSSIKVEYLVHQLEDLKDKPFKVADVITEGVSILNSQQSEFNSIITNQGIDALITELKSKLEKKATSAKGRY